MVGEALAALRAFRAGMYTCFGRRRDALFELLDALLTAGPCPSLPHLSLASGHRRGWGSVYAALRRGHVHVEALRALLLRQPVPEGPPVSAVDVRVWPRADAATSPERGSRYHSPRRRRAGGDPVGPGWTSQWLVRLSPARGSWTAPVDVRRVGLQETPTTVAVEQMKALVAARPAGDAAGRRWSSSTPATTPPASPPRWPAPGRPADPAAAQPLLLVRARARHPVPGGRPRQHGATFVGTDPTTWPVPTAEWRVVDEADGQVAVGAAQPARVVWLNWEGSGASLDGNTRTIESFQAQHQRITVENAAQTAGGATYWDKHAALKASGSPPDLWEWEPQHVVNSMLRKQVLDLQPLVARDRHDLSDFFPRGSSSTATATGCGASRATSPTAS